MDTEALQEMANQYAEVLQVEYDRQVELADTEAKTKAAKSNALANAYEQKVIDGKNADVRRRQEDALLAQEPKVIGAVLAEQQAQRDLSEAKIERQRVETVISLTKAWLYSQSGVGK